MAKYKVLKKFNDLEYKMLRNEGDVVDYTVKRANEIIDSIANQGFTGKYLERIAEDKREDSGE